MEIIKAKATSDFVVIERLAREIIPEYYQEYIPYEHSLFFLKKYQTVEEIRAQVQSGFDYFLLNEGRHTIGYLGLDTDKSSGTITLSKIYFLKEYRGKGKGSQALHFTETLAIKRSIKNIELITNRKNTPAIRFYEKHGYSITEELEHHFENGYTAEDYKMTKVL